MLYTIFYISLLPMVLCIERPNIIFIIADDLGWNDVGFHGSSQIPTPNIDALAYSGLILNNYYVAPICTPSRSALMTGKYPIHTGMQHNVLYGAEPRGLPLTETILPQYLKQLGYANHIVGKWHLGSYKMEYLPLSRGFESHVGYWTGHHDYFDHTAVERPGWGLDMRRNMDVAYDLHGQYSTDIFTNEAVKLIKAHNTTQPLFLYLAHAAVHSANPYNPLPAPDEYVAKFTNIKKYQRRRFAGVLSKLDESVGKVVEALESSDMLKNSVIVFTTDNGGPANGFNINAASNWPLRGVKHTLWEGGVRGVGLLWSPLLARPMRVAQQMMHITDWLPTLYSVAGGERADLGDIDGKDLWQVLSEDQVSDRTEILHNIDDILGIAALTEGRWKIVKGTTYKGAWDSWYGPSGRDGFYNSTEVTTCAAGRALSSIKKAATTAKILSLRSQAEVQCSEGYESSEKFRCDPYLAPCLFNVITDPCEKTNLASVYPNILKDMEQALQQLNASAVPPSNVPLDQRGDPRLWDYVWTNFGDYELPSNK